MADIIPVHLLDVDGNPSSGHRAIPCVSLQYTFDEPIQEEEGSRLSNLKRVWALLDTGADWNLIEKDLIPADLPVLDHITNNGVGGSEQTTNHRITLFFPELSWSQRTGIVGMARHGKAPYRIILGRKFLQCCRFIYDGRPGEISLEMIGGDHVQ